MSDLTNKLRSTLPQSPPAASADLERRRSAVALIMRQGPTGDEIFLIQRAPHESDPWSGNIAFPGGKVEPGDQTPRQAAERETREEVGIELEHADYLGFLTEIVGAHLPVRVACYVFLLTGPAPPLTLSREIADGFWVPLTLLLARENQVTAPVTFAGKTHQVPAIKLPHAGKPVLWGITYRLLQHFFALFPEETCVN